MENKRENKKSWSNSPILWVAVAVLLVLGAVAALKLSKSGLYGQLSAPAASDSDNVSGTDVTFLLEVTVGGTEALYSGNVSVAEGTVLIDALTANITENGGVVYSSGEYGAYITSICGRSENYETGEYWVFYVNGEMAMEGASTYQPAEGEEIRFDLSPLSW